MPSLRELQIQFVKALNNKDDSIFQHIQQKDQLTPEEHVHIYKSSTFGTLQKALHEIYPVCHRLVGEDFFLYLINAYIEKHISVHHDLACYGNNFADFIAEFEHAKSLVYLPDVARLEWAWHKQFTARYSPGLNFAKLAECYELHASTIKFHLPLDSILLCSAYPIHLIWEVNQKDYSGDQTVILEPGNYYYIVWRKALQMRIDILEYNEWQILQWAHYGHPFEKICEKFNDLIPDSNVEILMPKLVSCGWFTDFSIV